MTATLFEVSEVEIARLQPGELADVLNRLLWAEGRRLHLPAGAIRTTSNISVRDLGVDARVEDAPPGSPWVPSGTSVWQFKSGDSGQQPKKLSAILGEPGVLAAIRDGARLSIAVSARLNATQVEERQRRLRKRCEELGVPLDCFEILGAAQIACWVSEHPALALLPYFSHPAIADCMRWEDWASEPRHRNQFFADQQRSDIASQIARLAGHEGDSSYIRVEGLAGVGKTRLALESVRPTPTQPNLADEVLYAARPEDIPIGLFQWLRLQSATTLTLIVDECARDAAERLHQQVETCAGRLRLVTLGRPDEIPPRGLVQPGLVLVERLDPESMRQLVRTIAPQLPDEAVRFAVEKADGFVKLASAIASTLMQNPQLAARDLARVNDVREIIRRFVAADPADERAMKAISLLTRVGWEGDLAEEGRAVADFLSLDWQTAQDCVGRLVRQGLVAREGRYRYVTPHLVAVWLASIVWEDRGPDVLRLLTTLPTWNSRRAFLKRLRDLGDDPHARAVAGTLLGTGAVFPDLDAINDELRAEVLALLAETHPEAGLLALQRILDHLPRDELRRLQSGRSHVVAALEKLAWLPETFPGAAWLLLALAEAENESPGNNATGVWVGLFGVHLGGTAVPFPERLSLLEAALGHPSEERQQLAVKALNRALVRQESRAGAGEQHGGRLVPPEWHPASRADDRSARLAALLLLDRGLSSAAPAVRAASREVLLQRGRDLVRLGLATEWLNRVETVIRNSPDESRAWRNCLEAALKFHGSQLTGPERDRIATMVTELTGSSYGSRLRRGVGWRTLADRDADELEPGRSEREVERLAAEALAQPELLRAGLDWLASAEAHHAYELGKHLGGLDDERRWWSDLEALVASGRGRRLASGYLVGRRESGHGCWRETVLDAWCVRGGEFPSAVLDAIWCGHPDDRDGERLIRLVTRGALPAAHLQLLVFGGVTRTLGVDVFYRLVEAVVSDGTPQAAAVALELLDSRLRDRPEDDETLAPLVWRVLEHPMDLPGDSMAAFARAELAERFVERDPQRMAAILLDGLQSGDAPLGRDDDLVRVLSQATDLDPEGVWRQVAPRLLRALTRNGDLRLYVCLKGWYGDSVGEMVLLPWAEQQRPLGPVLAAALTPVGGRPLAGLARALLLRFGDDENVRQTLQANFGTGVFAGSMSEWIRAHLDTALEWLHDPEPAVREWASAIVQSYQEQLRRTLDWEAETLSSVA